MKAIVVNGIVFSMIISILVVAFATTAYANGVIIPDPPPIPPPHPRPHIVSHLPAAVKEAHISTTIQNQVAVTTVNQVFENPNRYPLEGTFVLPLPKGASISKLTFWMNGKEIKGEMLDASAARQYYTDIVRRLKDPALLEYAGDNLYKLKIFPIPAGGAAKVKFSYNQVLTAEAGLCLYTYPHSTNKYSSKPLQSATITIAIKSKIPLKSIYSPTHNCHITKKSDYEASVSYEAANVKPDTDFKLYYSFTNKEFGLNLITYAENAQPGYFLALLSPKYDIGSREIIAKDIVFVLDTSGSMIGEKIAQAKGALKFCVSKLNKGDRFNIIAFSDSTEKLKDGLQKAESAIVATAEKFINGLEAAGSTDINRALLEALQLSPAEGGRPFMIIFLTDGLPTFGQTDIEKILTNVKGKNTKNTRLFVFGVGNDVNAKLLDTLAEQNGGTRTYIAPAENIEEKVSKFYVKVASPVLTNLALEIEKVRIYQTVPVRLPDLFKGSQLVITGRYKGSGATTITLTGEVSGEKKRFIFEGTFPAADSGAAFLPRLWAARRIGFMLDEMRLHGSKEELVNEVIRLAKRFGIVTPYTSYIVTEGKPLKGGPAYVGEELFRSARKEAGIPDADEPTTPGDWTTNIGRKAIEHSKEAEGLKKEQKIPQRPMARGITESDGRTQPLMKYVGNKTFYYENGVWFDSECEKGSETMKIEAFSDKYFELLAQHPEIGKYLSVGERVVIKFKGKIYEIFTKKE